MWSAKDGVAHSAAGLKSRRSKHWRAVFPEEAGTTVMPISSAA